MGWPAGGGMAGLDLQEAPRLCGRLAARGRMTSRITSCREVYCSSEQLRSVEVTNSTKGSLVSCRRVLSSKSFSKRVWLACIVCLRSFIQPDSSCVSSGFFLFLRAPVLGPGMPSSAAANSMSSKMLALSWLSTRSATSCEASSEAEARGSCTKVSAT